MAGQALQYIPSTLKVIVCSAAKELFEKIKKLIVKNDKINSLIFLIFVPYNNISIKPIREKEQYRVLKIRSK